MSATSSEHICLSHLALARLASGQRAPGPDEAQKLQACPVCARRLQEETILAEAAAQEPVPEDLLRLARSMRTPRYALKRRLAHFVSVAPRAGATFALFIAVLLAGHEFISGSREVHALHAKGAMAVTAAVRSKSGEQSEFNDLARLQAVSQGDTVQLRVTSFEPMAVELSDADSNEVYYAGVVPAGGWLPVGIEVADGTPLKLKLKACETQNPDVCRTMELY